MFGSNKNREEAMAKTQIPTVGSNSLNSLVGGTKVEGNINAQTDFRIDGTLVGNLNGKQKVIIGTEGKVKGEIICKNAIIEGSFDGSLTVSGQLNIKTTAIVSGNVKTAELVVEGGAIFNVKCTMGSLDKSAHKFDHKSNTDRPQPIKEKMAPA